MSVGQWQKRAPASYRRAPLLCARSHAAASSAPRGGSDVNAAGLPRNHRSLGRRYSAQFRREGCRPDRHPGVYDFELRFTTDDLNSNAADHQLARGHSEYCEYGEKGNDQITLLRTKCRFSDGQMLGSVTAFWGGPTSVRRKCRISRGGERSREIEESFRVILGNLPLESKFGLQLDSRGYFWEGEKTLSL
jgi:hypothetical protein